MNGQELLNITLRLNAAFSLFSGLDFVIFDRAIVEFITGDDHASVFGLGLMLIGFAVFVFAVSMMKTVNKYLVGAIIASDVLWVLGSAGFVVIHNGQLTRIGQVAIVLVALVIGAFAYFQTKGLRRHLAAA